MIEKLSQIGFVRGIVGTTLLFVASIGLMTDAETLAQGPAPRAIPLFTLVPLPGERVSLCRNELELARYHYGGSTPRPFVFPIIGPSGKPLTRMGHPHDPHGHRHHRSVWVAHHDVSGVDFWGDAGTGRIEHVKLEALTDGDGEATLVAHNAWKAEEQGVLLDERRSLRFVDLNNGEWLMIVTLELSSPAGDVTLGKTPFGPLGVRMAKSIGVHDGGGTIRNSTGGVNEAEVLWKPARWVDYSGPISAQLTEGITLMDHPSNPRHPTTFHVRDDGWMGTSFTYNDSWVIEKGSPLRLRYGLYVHRGTPNPDVINATWNQFVQLTLAGDGAKQGP